MSGRLELVSVELVGGPRDGRHPDMEVGEDGCPPPGVQHQCMSDLATTLANGQCTVWMARYRRRPTVDADGVWRYDFDPAASRGGQLS